MNATHTTQRAVVASLVGIAAIVAGFTFATLASADASAPLTQAASAITSMDATLNATNGDTAATDSSFWVSTSTFSEASSTAPTLPAGVYSTPSLGAQGVSAAFSAQLSSATGMPAVTPDTTYFYEAWTEVGGVWSPGGVMSFTTLSAPTITSVSPATGTTAGGTEITITGTDFNTGASVMIGGTAATSVVVASSTSITAMTPAGTTGAADVVVTNSDTGTVTSTGGFTYAASVLPMISGVSVSATSSTAATVSWTTNEPTEGQVSYGTSATYGASSTMETSFGTNHSATLFGLTPSTTYHYQIQANDQASNSTTTTDATFMTSASSSSSPVISNVMVSAVGTSTATISWTTDLATSSQVFYGTTASYGSSSTLDSNATTTHSVMLTGLSEATLYHFDVQSGSATSADMTFDTGSTSSTTPLAVNGVTTVQGNATADGTFADGFQYIMHLTVPSVEDAFRMAFSDFTSTTSSSTIPANGNIRIYSPESSNASNTDSAITETGNGYSNWIYLNGDTATSTAGRQIDIFIGVSVPLGTPAGSYSTNFAAQSTPSSATSTTI